MRSRKQGDVFHFAPAILFDVDDLNVHPGQVAARHAIAERENNLTNCDPVRVDLAEKANHDPVITSTVLWHGLPRPLHHDVLRDPLCSPQPRRDGHEGTLSEPFRSH
jgi:hypothetical protein